MPQTYSMKKTSENDLVITSGIGIANYEIREEGKFQVRFGSGFREFRTLVGCSLFYMSLTEDATIWDMTSGPILIEEKVIIART